MTQPIQSPLIAKAEPVGILVVESGSISGQRFPLPAAPGALLLGREKICNVRFDPEQDRVVGRTHARVEVRPDGIFLIDLHSANGTFRADGSAVRGESRLSPGDRFQLGGEGGPWISLLPPSTNIALHVAPPRAEPPTVLIRPVALPVERTVSDPVASAPSSTHATSTVTRSLASVSPAPDSATAGTPVPAPLQPAIPTPHRPKEDEFAARVKQAPTDYELIAAKHHQQYRRQIAVITLLLLLSCSVGLALGLREGPDDEQHAQTE